MGKPTRVINTSSHIFRSRSFLRVALSLALTPAVWHSLPRAFGESPPSTPRPAARTNTTFKVEHYVLEGNTVLPTNKVSQVLTPYTGPAVDIDKILKGVGELQLLYRRLGFATVAVTVPQQQVTNGVVRLKVTEGRVSEIHVNGNRHFSSNNVMRLFPGLSTNVILNTKWFQPELDRANVNPDRQIYPVIAPGQAPGETSLTLNVKDRLPVHGHVEINNIATPHTPPLRIDASVQDNNLWQADHQAGVEYNFSPQAWKDVSHEPRFYDQPEVVSYSGFYRVPFHADEDLRAAYEKLPVDFGYDPVAHTFHLPPATGSPELNFYASRSFTETPTLLGPLATISSSALLDLTSQSAQRNIIASEGAGSQFTVPLREFGRLKSSISLGFDYKNFQMQSYSTNISYIQTYATNSVGTPTLTGSTNVPIASNSRNNLNYVPLAISWDASRDDSSGATSFHLGDSIFLSPLASGRSNFRSVAGTVEAGGNYTIVNAAVIREQKLRGDWSLLFRANGQWSSAPLISNEQFALGGVAGIRGYVDGESYGDDGWRLMLDLRAPPFPIGSFPSGAKRIPAYARCSLFTDYGTVYGTDHAISGSSVSQLGTGVDVHVSAGEHVDARFTLGWALQDSPLTRAGSARASFKVGFQF
jgi:hemolysin activation/secretion protein